MSRKKKRANAVKRRKEKNKKRKERKRSSRNLATYQKCDRHKFSKNRSSAMPKLGLGSRHPWGLHRSGQERKSAHVKNKSRTSCALTHAQRVSASHWVLTPPATLSPPGVSSSSGLGLGAATSGDPHAPPGGVKDLRSPTSQQAGPPGSPSPKPVPTSVPQLTGVGWGMVGDRAFSAVTVSVRTTACVAGRRWR